MDGEEKDEKERGKWKGKEKRNIEFELKKSLIHQKKPQDLRRTNIRGLTRASAPTVRKETI